METITNLASTAATTASKLIYGDQTKTEEAVDQTKNNETAGKEPISGEQGQGTVNQPYDQGNLATPLAAADKGTFLDYSNNETAGKEPVSGELGKGTVTEPFDQGNDAKATEKATEKTPGSNEFLKLDPATEGPTETKPETSTEPKIYSDHKDPSYVGMPIIPLNPDDATSNTGASSTTQSTGITDKAGVTDKLWKETPLDDISRSGAPGAGPTATESTATTTTGSDPTIKTSAPDSVTAGSSVYGTGAGSDTKTDAEIPSENRDTPGWTSTGVPSENRDTPGWTSTGVPSDSSNFDAATAKQNAASGGSESKGLAGEHVGRKSESADLTSSPSNEEKGGKMSHLKEKMKNKLHIGSKDK